MRNRTLVTAAVAMLTVNFAAGPGVAQNLDAGKSAAQIFSNSCAACHRGPRGLVKSVSPQALPGFLRQHYTTGTEMAGLLSGYLLANGGVAESRQPRGKDEARHPATRPEPPKGPSTKPAASPPLRAWRLPWETQSPAEAAAVRTEAEAEPKARAGEAKRRPRRDQERRDTVEPAAGEAAPAAPAPASSRTEHKDQPQAEQPATDHSAGAKEHGEGTETGAAAVAPAASPDKPPVPAAPDAAETSPQDADAAPRATSPGKSKTEENETDEGKSATHETAPAVAKPATPAHGDPVPHVTPAPSEGETKPASGEAQKPAADTTPPADAGAAQADGASAPPKPSSDSQ
jgi:hypothetical protein